MRRLWAESADIQTFEANALARRQVPHPSASGKAPGFQNQVNPRCDQRRAARIPHEAIEFCGRRGGAGLSYRPISAAHPRLHLTWADPLPRNHCSRTMGLDAKVAQAHQVRIIAVVQAKKGRAELM
jgi:hypothetical protein